jgi:hypothetical protein
MILYLKLLTINKQRIEHSIFFCGSEGILYVLERPIFQLGLPSLILFYFTARVPPRHGGALLSSLGAIVVIFSERIVLGLH